MRHFRIAALAAATSMLTMPLVAYAEPASPAPEADAGADIIVTAQKRDQTLIDVGMSVSVLGAAQLDAQRVHDVEDLAQVVPGLTYTTTQFAEAVYTLRGVGYVESSLAANPAVSVYVDEVPLPYPSMTRGAMIDQQRVEVLKGPQGTLYGQSSTGGAINYIAAKPTSTFEAGVEATYARFDSFEGSGFVSGPLSSTLNARLAVDVVQGGDWQRSLTRDDTLGGTDQITGRLLVDWRPTTDFKLSINLNGWRDRSDNPAAQNRGIYPAVPTNPLPDAFLDAPLAPNDPRAADWDANRVYDRDNRFYQGVVRADWTIAPEIVATSISAYQHLKRESLNEADGTAIQNVNFGTGGHVKSFYQELRLAGSGPRLHWIVGANYQSDRILDLQFAEIDQSTSSTVGPFHFATVNNQSTNRVETFAGYASADYAVTDTLNLTIGARYTKAKNRYASCTRDAGDGVLAALANYVQFLAGGSGQAPAVPGGCVTLLLPSLDIGLYRDALNQDNLSWRSALNWKATPDVALYASVSTGYKAGNFPTLSASTSTQLSPATQERLMAYEAGFHARVPDLGLRLAGAAFYYDYKDKQLRGRLVDPLYGQLEALLNIPKSHAWGLEGEMSWTPVRQFTANASVSYLKTEIDGAYEGYSQFPGPIESFSGNGFPFAPKVQAAANAEYRDATGWGSVDWFAGAAITYRTHAKAGLEEDPRLVLPGYTLLDLNLGIADAAAGWKATIWGKNVTNKYYQVYLIAAQDSLAAYTGRPATYGITVSKAF